jgi:hypothetical protein
MKNLILVNYKYKNKSVILFVTEKCFSNGLTERTVVKKIIKLK